MILGANPRQLQKTYSLFEIGANRKEVVKRAEKAIRPLYRAFMNEAKGSDGEAMYLRKLYATQNAFKLLPDERKLIMGKLKDIWTTAYEKAQGKNVDFQTKQKAWEDFRETEKKEGNK